jgi:hypothetical protein
MTGTGGGSLGYAGVLQGGVFLTNGPGLLSYGMSASGHDWDDLLKMSTNTFVGFLRDANPDLVTIESRGNHGITPVPDSVLALLTNTLPNAVVLLTGPYSSPNNGAVNTQLYATNNFQSAIKFGLSYLDTWTFMHDTNWMAKNGFFVDTTHLAAPGIHYEAGLLLKALGLGDWYFSKNLINQANNTPVAFGSANPLARLHVVVPNLVAQPNRNYDWLLDSCADSGDLGFFLHDPILNYTTPYNTYCVKTNAFLTVSGTLVSLSAPNNGYLSFGLGFTYNVSPSAEQAIKYPNGQWYFGDYYSRITAPGLDLGGPLETNQTTHTPTLAFPNNGVGYVHFQNTISTGLSNRQPAGVVTVTTGNFYWSNSLNFNLTACISGGAIQGICVNSNYWCGPVTNGEISIPLQAYESLVITNTTAPTFRWKPF